MLLFQSWNTLELDEIKVMDIRIGEILDSSSSPLIHGIHDLSKIKNVPSPKDLMKLKSSSHPCVGWFVFVGLQNKLVKFFVSATGQVLQLRLRFFDTLEEALEFLQLIDTSLPDLKLIDLAAAEARIGVNAAAERESLAS